MYALIRRALLSAPLAALAWAVAVSAGLSSGGCGVDDRKVGIGRLEPDASVSPVCGPACPEVLCPADDACKDYSDLLPRGSCNPANTACATVVDCGFTWKTEARDGAACACGAAGCKLLPGEVCTRPEACDGSSCVATDEGQNVCCAATCGPSDVCAPDGSACALATPCTDDDRRCSSGVYQNCTGGVWQEVTDCGELGCSIERGGCLRSAGQVCEVDEDCGVGSCVATAAGTSVCCTGPCDTSCRRCAESGESCVDIADDDACEAIECPTDACRSYTPATVTTNRCAEGQCATAAEACTVFEPARADLECSSTALCDDQGNCSRPKKALLQPCGTGSECDSAACVATLAGTSVCCAEACAADQICNAAGACELAPVCDDDATRCSGSNFQRCTNRQWRTVFDCGSLGCSVAREGCFGGAGDTCAADTDCGEGSCQATSSGAQVCCTSACEGACRRCAPSGAACENIADDSACGIVPCGPDTTCRDLPLNITSGRCDGGGRCASAAQLCVGTSRNSGQACSAANLCDGSGNCSLPKKALGVACGVSAECAQGNCVGGVCCNSACNGVCATCAGTGGVCSAPTADNRCTQTGLCASVGVCQQPVVGCGNQSCPVTGAVCCSELSAAGNTRLFCQTGAEVCPAPPAFIPSVPINCDEHLDCPPSRVCCRAGTSTSMELSCKLPNPSPDTDELSIDFESCDPLNPMLFGDQLCESPRGRFDCPSFQDCTGTNSRLPGYIFCQ